MNASRLLFEGLEERVLLSGIPLAVIASLPRFTESHSGSTGEITVGTTGNFTLSKFDDRGGIAEILNGGRVLVGVTIESATEVIQGTRLAENTSNFAGTLSVLTLTLTVESNVFVVVPHVTPEFNFQLITSASLQNDPDYATLKNIGAKATLDWLPNIKSGQTYPDLRSITLAGMTSGPQQEKLSYPTDPLDDYIISGSDSTILFETSGTTATSLTATVAARSQTSPQILYEMTGRVIYEYAILGTGKEYRASRYKFEQAPAPMFQPFYSGTAQPGATLAVDVLGVGGEVLGSTSTIVDAGGNWAASFYDLGMTGQPHTVSIRQSYAGYTPLTGAGYNLRRYFSPAILGGAYASEHLTVENVLGNRAADVSMAALYTASAHPIVLGPTLYAYEMLPLSASSQGLN